MVCTQVYINTHKHTTHNTHITNAHKHTHQNKNQHIYTHTCLNDTKKFRPLCLHSSPLHHPFVHCVYLRKRIASDDETHETKTASKIRNLGSCWLFTIHKRPSGLNFFFPSRGGGVGFSFFDNVLLHLLFEWSFGVLLYFEVREVFYSVLWAEVDCS